METKFKLLFPPWVKVGHQITGHRKLQKLLFNSFLLNVKSTFSIYGMNLMTTHLWQIARKQTNTSNILDPVTGALDSFFWNFDIIEIS